MRCGFAAVDLLLPALNVGRVLRPNLRPDSVVSIAVRSPWKLALFGFEIRSRVDRLDLGGVFGRVFGSGIPPETFVAVITSSKDEKQQQSQRNQQKRCTCRSDIEFRSHLKTLSQHTTVRMGEILQNRFGHHGANYDE